MGRQSLSKERTGSVLARLKPVGRVAAAILVPFALWWALVLILRPDAFILPGPDRVVLAFIRRWPELLSNGLTTALEMVLGLVTGSLFGAGLALVMGASPRFGRLATPIIVTLQSLPIYVIAPMLVVWFGFGLTSKIIMATIVIFFPVTSSFYDGLTRTDGGLLDLARLYGADRRQELMLIRLPWALPGLVSGLRMAATIAPFGAVIGEWVGASSGLGLVILQTNARLQTDFTFAAVTVVIVLAIAIRLAVDALTRRLVPWAPETAR